MNHPRDAVAREVTRLAEWITSVSLENIPPHILERAARVLADDIGAIIGARDEPEVAAFHARTLATAQTNEATVFRGSHVRAGPHTGQPIGQHTRLRTERRDAAVANGLAADWLELDEGYRVTPCQIGRAHV